MPEQFNVELLDAARWRLDSFTRYQWNRAFVQSIAARRPSALTERSYELLSRVQSQSPGLIDLVLETFLEVAPHPGHPLNAVALHNTLKGWSMPTRDVLWSIPTYSAFDSGGALDRLIRWSARGPYSDCTDEVIELAAVPLIWTFTSPNRRMRDYATKALVRLLSGNLSVLPSLIRRFDGVNDPYVVERLAVVAHGAVLCGGSEALDAAVATAEELKRVALAEEQVPNIITRDAVRGVYEWCARHNLIARHVYAEMLPPYSSAPPQEPRTTKQLECAYGRDKHHGGDISWPYKDLFYSILGATIVGDFGRYVVEPELMEFSQYPLSSARPRRDREAMYPLEAGRCWVFERVLSLGWTPRKFGEFDQYLGNRAWYLAGRGDHKAERFGKKYQWIALRELVARVADNFHMNADFGDQPVTYTGPWQFSGRDIDPTLPAPTRKRNEDDSFELSPTFASNDEAWWAPPGPSYHHGDPPVGEDWAAASDDIPEFEPLVRKRDKSGTRWVVLHANCNWDDEVPEDEERRSRRCRNLWSHIRSWLVQPADQDVLVGHLEQHSLMG
ncbi:MAG: hypothetical protein OXH85_01930 [Truepera sp.]|nr:hypothetical protein [Truepera sp.]